MTDYFDLLDVFFKSIGQPDYFFSPYDLVNDDLEKKKLAIKAIDFLLSKNDKGLYKETWNFIGYRQLSQINLKDLKPLCPTNVYKFLEDRYAAYKKVETLEGYEKPVVYRTLEYSKRTCKLFEMIRADNHMSLTKYAEAINFSVRTAKKITDYFINKGYLEKIGTGKKLTWIIKKDVHPGDTVKISTREITQNWYI